MGKGILLLAMATLGFLVLAVVASEQNPLIATTEASATSEAWLSEVNGGTMTAAADDQVQLQAVRIEKDIGAAEHNDVLAAVEQNAKAPNMTGLQNEINVSGSGACFRCAYA